MISKEEKINTLFLYWLIFTLILVFSIIVVGGLTRLTNSGLSIIEWELFKGILPPLSNSSWDLYFEKYKTIPQYKLLNFNMSLQEFKVIFYWEYFHRLLARLIGLFFLIPLIYFYLSKKIHKDYIKICFLIFFLILFQGVIGWYMVKSGLIDDVTVSHYRLSLHLTIAIIIISLLFWLTKNFYEKKNKVFFTFSNEFIPFQVLLIIIFFQIIIGAFVSGLDAGMIYQNWPMMGNSFFPSDIKIENLNNILELNNHSLVQFYHRCLAYLLLIYVGFLTFFIYKKKIKTTYKPLNILLFFLIIQIILGIFTLLSGLNIYLASAHQITSVLLVFSALNLYYSYAK
tara:strand:+ start:3749 stop:4774 length:1026 start_codon:yes stop_codon:yes gene_type:complete